MNRKSLGDRMKDYESVPKNFLMRRQPVIIRLDMKSGRSFTRGFDKPFDIFFMKAMEETAKYLCENIQNCIFSYIQSDKISLVLCDYKHLDTDAWFAYNVQKLVSVSAAMATSAFNIFFHRIVENYFSQYVSDYVFDVDDELLVLYEKYSKKFYQAIFDSRTFNLPKEEVNNYFIWRQQDAIRNSIQSLAQSLYSSKELQGINTKELQDKMLTEKGINWNDLPSSEKRGTCCIETIVQNPNVDPKDGYCPKRKWNFDKNIPIFSKDEDYINNKIIFKEEN